MKSPSLSCREARRDLLRRDDLDAVRRGLLDVHLRRCDTCRGIAEALARIEERPEPMPEIDGERIQRIYGRLVPAVHQITGQIEKEREARTPIGRLPAIVFGAGLALATIAVVLVLALRPEASREPSKPTAAATPARAPEPAAWAKVELREGAVRVDGRALGNESRFPLLDNTRVEIGSGSRLGLRLGALAKIDLAGDTALVLSGVAEGRIAANLEKGLLTVDFDRGAGRSLTVTTPDLEVHVKGTIFTVEARPGGPSSVTVAKGVVEVVPRGNRQARVEVAAGERVSFPPVGQAEPVPAAAREAKAAPARISGPRAGRPALSSTGTPVRRKDPYAQARAEMASGNLPRAINLLEQANARATGTQRVAGMAMLAECYRASANWGKAADTYDAIVRLDPGSLAAENARYEIGRMAMDQIGDLSRARAAFAAYLASPRAGGLKEDASFSLCEIDGRQGAHRRALQCFDRFLDRFQGGRYEPVARLWRGALYQDVEQKWAKAEPDLRFFLAERPKHPRADEARYRLALGRFQRADQAGALEAIREYLRLHPDGKYRLRVERLRQAIVSPNANWEPAK